MAGNPSTRERDETITEAHERVAILRECMAQPREKGSTVLGWKRYVDGLDREASRVESLLALLEDGERVGPFDIARMIREAVVHVIENPDGKVARAIREDLGILHPTEEGHDE